MLAEKYVNAINDVVEYCWKDEEKSFLECVGHDVIANHILINLITLKFVITDEIQISRSLADAILQSGVEVGDLKYHEFFDDYCDYDEYVDVAEDDDGVSYYLWKTQLSRPSKEHKRDVIITKIKEIIDSYGSFKTPIKVNQMGNKVAITDQFNYNDVRVEIHDESEISSPDDIPEAYYLKYADIDLSILEEILESAKAWEIGIELKDNNQ